MTETIQDRFRPSNMAKVIACPASASREVGLPDPGSYAAAQGSVAHLVAAARFKPDWKRSRWLGHTIPWSDDKPDAEVFAVKVDAEMLGHVEEYYNYVMSFGAPVIERPVNLTAYGIKSGTTDAAVLTPDVLHVFDLKYGRGVHVGVTGNPQLSTYTLGLLDDWAPLFNTPNPAVWMHIFQPRGHGISVYKTDALFVGAHFRVILKEAIAAALVPRPPARAGDHCRNYFCRFRADCPEYTALATGAVDMVDPRRAPPAVIEAAWMRVGAARDWCNQIEARMFELARQAPHLVPKAKIVLGDGRRYWINDDDVRGLAFKKRVPVDDVSPRELRSVAQLELQLGKAEFIRLGFPMLVEKKPGAPTLARAEDPRPAFSSATAPADFPDLDDPLALPGD